VEGEAEEEEPEEEEPEGEENAEEEKLDENGEPIKKPKVLFFKESDYHLRVPLPFFQHMKTTETLAMSSVKTQPKLKVHVLCSGLRYGNGEQILYEHFKKAWLQNPNKLEYIGTGENLIPTIHYADLARLVKRVVTTETKKNYIFAIDRTVKPTQKRIIQAISNGTGTAEIESKNEEYF
jgi:adenylate kinase